MRKDTRPSVRGRVADEQHEVGRGCDDCIDDAVGRSGLDIYAVLGERRRYCRVERLVRADQENRRLGTSALPLRLRIQGSSRGAALRRGAGVAGKGHDNRIIAHSRAHDQKPLEDKNGLKPPPPALKTVTK
jgi:hypothetical protein